MHTEKKHILLVTSEFPPQPGGIGTHAYHLAKHLEAESYEVNVIADQRSVSGEEEHTFDSRLSFKVHRVTLRRFRWLMYLKRIYLLFKMISSVDVVIASGKFSLWIVAFVSLFYKRQYIAVLHGSEVNFTNGLLRLSIHASLKRFSKLIAVSSYTKALVADIQKPVIVIPNGIDTTMLDSVLVHPIALKGTPKLITVGNVTERKGQLNVIRQLPELLNVYPNLHYHCVGLPTTQAAFLKIAEDLNVANHITFHGRISESELYSYLQSSDIFVMLSRETQSGDVEGFGIALIEANYFGVPCIGAKGCGIEDAISDYKSGRLILPTDTEGFKIAINDILSHYDTYSTIAKTWSLQHAWSHIVTYYIKAIED